MKLFSEAVNLTAPPTLYTSHAHSSTSSRVAVALNQTNSCGAVRAGKTNMRLIRAVEEEYDKRQFIKFADKL